MAISTLEPFRTHLTQQKLSKDDKDILTRLADWVSEAKFTRYTEVFDLCVDDERFEKWALLEGMELIKKVQYGFL